MNEKKYYMTLGHQTFDIGSVQIQVKNEEYNMRITKKKRIKEKDGNIIKTEKKIASQFWHQQTIHFHLHSTTHV